MSKKLKVVGSLFVLSAAVCFLINFHIFLHSWPLTLFPSYFFNPLSLLIKRIVGNIPLISSGLAYVLTYLFALLYSAGLLAIGIVAIRHKSKPKFPLLS
jgi:FtsH-binding integral membrane protein